MYVLNLMGFLSKHISCLIVVANKYILPFLLRDIQWFTFLPLMPQRSWVKSCQGFFFSAALLLYFSTVSINKRLY